MDTYNGSKTCHFIKIIKLEPFNWGQVKKKIKEKQVESISEKLDSSVSIKQSSRQILTDIQNQE